MSDDPKDTGGAGTPDVGGADDSKDQNKKPDPKPSKTVAREDHDRALKDLHKFKREAEDTKAALAKIEEERLREKEDWKGLAEREKLKAEKLEADNKKLTDVFLRTQKYSAVKTAAVEAGLLPEALDDLELLELNGVAVETTNTGRYSVQGAKEFVEELKGKKSHWFGHKKPVDINGGTGGGAPGPTKKITPIDLLDAEKKVKMGLMKQEAYNELFVKYRKQGAVKK